MLRDWLDRGSEPARALPVSAAPAPVVRGDWLDDDIPDLDEARSSAEAVPATSTARDTINAAVPLRRPKPTVAAWLDQLAASLERCASNEEVEAVLLSDEVCRAGRTLKGTARDRLRELMDTALARHAAAGNDRAGGGAPPGGILDDAIPF